MCSWPPAACRAWHRKWPRAPSRSSPSTRLLFRRLTAPRAKAPASTLESAPLVTATGWGISEPSGMKLQKTTRGAGWEPQASSTELPLTPWMDAATSSGFPGDRVTTKNIGAALGNPASPPCPQPLHLFCSLGGQGRVRNKTAKVPLELGGRDSFWGSLHSLLLGCAVRAGRVGSLTETREWTGAEVPTLTGHQTVWKARQKYSFLGLIPDYGVRLPREVSAQQSVFLISNQVTLMISQMTPQESGDLCGHWEVRLWRLGLRTPGALQTHQQRQGDTSLPSAHPAFIHSSTV